MRAKSNLWLTLILLNIAIVFSSCDASFGDEVQIPEKIELENAHELVSFPFKWIEPNDWVFVYSPQAGTKVISYNVESGSVKILNTPDLGVIPFVTISLDGTLLGYSLNYENLLGIRNLQTNEIVVEIEGNSLEFSPDNQKVLVWQLEKLALVDLFTQNEETIYIIDKSNSRNEGRWNSKTLWRPNSNEVAFLFHDYNANIDQIDAIDEIILIDLATKEAKPIITENVQIEDFSWSPNGNFVVYATTTNQLKDSYLHIFDVVNNCLVGSIKTKWPATALWSPDGSRILHQIFNSTKILNIREHFGVEYEQLTCPEPISQPSPTPTDLELLNERTMNLIGEPASEVADFLLEIQNSLVMDDKEKFASLVLYPITIHSINGEDITIQTAEDFIANYDKIVTIEWKDVILSQDLAELFVNWKGVMVNKGELWFGPVCVVSPDCEEREYYILAFNSPILTVDPTLEPTPTP